MLLFESFLWKRLDAEEFFFLDLERLLVFDLLDEAPLFLLIVASLVFLSFKPGSSFLRFYPSAITKEPPQAMEVTSLPLRVSTG